MSRCLILIVQKRYGEKNETNGKRTLISNSIVHAPNTKQKRPVSESETHWKPILAEDHIIPKEEE
ncbi:hypothetical protein B0H19DRAFT_1180498 [Mycena capillaripes]|nr:hypothetical protein B0H19DRAFT_1180498 [Mycena capillaripes]